MFRGLALGAAVVLAGVSANAQDQRDGVYIIYDSSNSMWGALPDDSRKYEAARTAMRELAGQNFDNRDVALRMYGHRRKNDCTDSELVVPWSDPSSVGDQIVTAMETVRPTGRTPIDLSLRAALQDFGDRSGTIILISDGIESCDADPCALVREWNDRNVDIEVHVVGLGLRGKERAAMQCIAEAAGTEYRDAFSADELIAGLGAAVEAGVPGDAIEPAEGDPQPQVAEARVRLDVATSDGELQRGRAVFTPVAGGDAIVVNTDGRFLVPAGDYTVSAGVMTVTGDVYRPVTRDIAVGFDGADMKVLIEDAARPPEVSARFSMDGEAVRETVVTVYRDDEKLGSFKGQEVAFVPEGTFDFRARPSGTSQDLSVTESFADGDKKEISFEAAVEVRLKVHVIPDMTGERFRATPELFQGGELVQTINGTSGGLVRPGTYLFRLDDSVNLFETEIVVSNDPEQFLELVVPSGALVVNYVDANGVPEDPKRVFLYPASGKGGKTKTAGEAIGLLPGTYIVDGHPRGQYPPNVTVEIVAGETKTLTLQAIKTE